MRCYIEGTCSVPQPGFHITNLWFANEEAADTDFPSLNCLGLSCDGFDCETSVTEDGMSFSSRWKNVYLNDVDEDNMAYQTSLFGLEQLKLMLKQGNMKLMNLEAFVNGNVTIKITSIKLVENNKEYKFEDSIPEQDIEFIE